MNTKEQFHREMLRIYEQAREFGYYPTYFLQMVGERGGLGAAKKLLEGDEISSGLKRLGAEQRLDISMEALVLQERWSTLFTDEELAMARRRLEELDYSP